MPYSMKTSDGKDILAKRVEFVIDDEDFNNYTVILDDGQKMKLRIKNVLKKVIIPQDDSLRNPDGSRMVRCEFASIIDMDE